MVAAAVELSVKCRKVRGLLLPGHEQHRRDFPKRRGTRLAQHMDASVYVHPDQAAQALSIILDGGFCTCARAAYRHVGSQFRCSWLVADCQNYLWMSLEQPYSSAITQHFLLKLGSKRGEGCNAAASMSREIGKNDRMRFFHFS